MNIFLDKEQEMMYNNYINNKNKKLNLGREKEITSLKGN